MTPFAELAVSADAREEVIVVDAFDHPIGTAPKLAAHVTGMLHRAVSVLVTDADGRVLLQQRAAGKYHSAGLWTNTACGHPRPGETRASAGERRLFEEMGVRCALEPAGVFLYRAELPCGLVEHEIDQVFVGRWTGRPVPDPAEVSAWVWADAGRVRIDVRARPERYTAWLGNVLEHATAHLTASRSPLRERSDRSPPAPR